MRDSSLRSHSSPKTWFRGMLVGLTMVAVHATSSAAEPASQAAASRSTVVPVESFFRNPQVAAAKLSPSGRWLALAFSAGEGRNELVVMDTRDRLKITPVAKFADADIDEFYWVSDDHLVFDLVQFQRGGGEQRVRGGLYSVSRDGTDQRQLVRPSWTPPQTTGTHIASRALDAAHSLLAVPSNSNLEVIVGERRWDARGNLERVVPKRLNIETGRAVNLMENGWPSLTTQWLFDDRGTARVALVRREGRVQIQWRSAGDADWKQIADFDRGAIGFMPAHVTSDGTLLVRTVSGEAGLGELRRFDFSTQQPEREPFVRTPGFDFLGGPVYEWIGGEMLGVRAITDAETTAWFLPAMKEAQRAIDAKLPGRVNRLSCRRCGQPDMVVLVYSFSDRAPGDYFLYEHAKQTLQHLIASRTGVDPRRMGTLDLHRIKARDGLELPVWITTPAGNASKPPAVVLVHGGPWVRGVRWQWSGMSQFLASRGYVVIEPEFRGSTGYGERHHRAGWRQWGQTMQDDLVDAVEWAKDKGLIDATRVCIMGGSYGGYAALMGVVRHQEHFRCAVASSAVTDPRLMFDTSSWASDISDESARFDLPRLVGHPDNDAAMFTANAPTEQAARIKAPVLLAYGYLDRRVPIKHGERMRKALTDAGNPPEWVQYNEEGHGWLLESNRYDYARRVEVFLGKHLAVR